MRKTVMTVVVLFILSLVYYSTYGQPGMGSGPSARPRFYADFNPVVGGWAEYQMRGKGESSGKMKVAIVGKEDNGYWYEMVMEGPRGRKSITKMLVSGDPSEAGNVKRLIVKTEDKPAMEMPLHMRGDVTKPQEPKGKAVDKGQETVTVPAGTFTAQHIQYQDAGGRAVDTWVVKDISPYGMVKTQSQDFEMVLVGHGTGATTLITETPQQFEMPRMPFRRKGN